MLNLYFWLIFATETVNNSKINQTKAASKNINKQQQTPKKENVIPQSEHIDIYVHIIDLKVCFSKRGKKGENATYKETKYSGPSQQWKPKDLLQRSDNTFIKQKFWNCCLKMEN